MLALYILWQVHAHASLPTSSIPYEDRIVRQPWWERTPPPPPPPEATTPPAMQPYSLGEFDPIEGVIFTTWYSDTVDTWTAMIRVLVDRGIPTYVCDSPMPRYWSELELRDAGVDPAAVDWLDCELDTVWMRDFGPMFTINEDAELGIGDARYYSDRYLDDSFPDQASAWWGVDFYEIPVWMEGGNFYADGHGTCVATNIIYEWYRDYYPWFTADFVSGIFSDTLGCDETIWLEPLDGEGTGHVDMFFTFVDHENVIVGSYWPGDDAFGSNAALLDRNAVRLEAAGYTVHRVPMLPNADLDGDGYEDFHTVINGFFANMEGETPLFVAPYFPSRYPDKSAASIAALRAAMPGVDVVPIPSESIIIAGGALHCVMKSIPTARWPMPCDDPYPFNDDDPRCSGMSDGDDDGGSEASGADGSDDLAPDDSGGGDSDSGSEETDGSGGDTEGGETTSPYEDDTGMAGGTGEDGATDESGGYGTADEGIGGGSTFNGSSGSGTFGADDDDEDDEKIGCTTAPARPPLPWVAPILVFLIGMRRTVQTRQ